MTSLKRDREPSLPSEPLLTVNSSSASVGISSAVPLVLAQRVQREQLERQDRQARQALRELQDPQEQSARPE
jgi:hypothetical protein